MEALKAAKQPFDRIAQDIHHRVGGTGGVGWEPRSLSRAPRKISRSRRLFGLPLFFFLRHRSWRFGQRSVLLFHNGDNRSFFRRVSSTPCLPSGFFTENIERFANRRSPLWWAKNTCSGSPRFEDGCNWIQESRAYKKVWPFFQSGRCR